MVVLHANVKGTKALNVISDMPCAKVRLQVGLNSLPVNSLPVAAAYKPLTGQMGHIEPKKVPCLQRVQRERERGRKGIPSWRLSITVARKTPIALCHLPVACNPLTAAPLPCPLAVPQLSGCRLSSLQPVAAERTRALILFAAAICDCRMQDQSICVSCLPAS